MLIGGFQHNIDKKGRIFIPAKFRDDLGDSFIVCRSIYGKYCLCVYSLEQWDKLCQKIETLPAVRSNEFKRYLFDGAFNVEFDTQGRILIPASLREFAKLDAEARIIGMNTNVEIWSTDAWHEEETKYTPESIVSHAIELDF